MIVFVEPTFYQRMVGVAAGLALILLTIYLLRRFQIHEKHGLPWLLGGVTLVVFSFFVPLQRTVTEAIGAGTPITAMFGGCILFLIALNMLFSLSLSRQKKQIQQLAIELAIRDCPPPQEREGRLADDPGGETTGAAR
jgi:hypothetical protein